MEFSFRECRLHCRSDSREGFPTCYLPAAMDSFPLMPRDVFEELRRTVVGQDDAIREIAVALVKHLVGHPAPNILLIGNSGSGKTTLMRSVETFLASKPELRSHFANVVRINANIL